MLFQWHLVVKAVPHVSQSRNVLANRLLRLRSWRLIMHLENYFIGQKDAQKDDTICTSQLAIHFRTSMALVRR